MQGAGVGFGPGRGVGPEGGPGRGVGPEGGPGLGVGGVGRGAGGGQVCFICGVGVEAKQHCIPGVNPP